MPSSEYFKIEGGKLTPNETMMLAERQNAECINRVEKKKNDTISELIKNSVLLCEKPSENLSKIRTELSEAGYMVFVAHTATDFFEILNKTKVRNIMINLDTPGVDLRKYVDSHAIRVIVSEDSNITDIMSEDSEVLSSDILDIIKSQSD